MLDNSFNMIKIVFSFLYLLIDLYFKSKKKTYINKCKTPEFLWETKYTYKVTIY